MAISTRKELSREETILDLLDKKKGLVCREFEKVCPTDSSFKRMVKEMHYIFDDLKLELDKIKTD